MSDLLVGLGLVFVIEGLLWALFPGFLLAMLEASKTLPEHSLRSAGAVAIAIGVIIVWLVRG